jgi:hypothetical protein
MGAKFLAVNCRQLLGRTMMLGMLRTFRTFRTLRPLGPLGRCLFVAALGGLLGTLVVADRLLGATYAHDVATLCNAEANSGFATRRNAARLTRWTQSHMQTAEGGRFLASLRDLPLDERAGWLEQRSRAAGLSSCSMVASYEELARRWRSKQELQRLCSAFSFPDLEKLDPLERIQVIDEWIALNATTPEVRLLGSRLRRTATAAARAELLRDEAGDFGILTCDVAKVLPVPIAQSCGP